MADPVEAPQRLAEAPAGEVVLTPDPLALARRVTRQSWPYAAGLVAALAVVGAVFRHQLNWGDFPTWVMAITTVLAVLAAAFAGLVAYELFKVEAARDLKAAEERTLAADERERVQAERAARLEADKRAQASKVTAYFGRFQGSIDRRNPPVWGAIVTNASELPVFDVRIIYYWVNDPGDGSPWTTEPSGISMDSIRVVPPGQRRDRELTERDGLFSGEPNDQTLLVGIGFTDANSRRWYRDERGALHDRGMTVPGSAQAQESGQTTG